MHYLATILFASDSEPGREMTAANRLRHGHFFGDRARTRRIGGLALAEMRPTVPEHEVESHTHDDAHFLLLLEGRYLSSAQGMPAVCAEPALLLNPPGTTHRDCFRGVNGRFFTLSVPDAVWRRAMAERRLPQHALRMSGFGLTHAMRLCRELRHWDSASPLVIETGLERLFDDAAAERARDTGDGPAWLDRARERLREDCLHTPRLAELAREAGVHPVHFARAFRRRYHCSPGDYLRRCRLERSLDLLRMRERSLADIAASCGFSDQAHFSHAFRRAFGCSPGQYRIDA